MDKFARRAGTARLLPWALALSFGLLCWRSGAASWAWRALLAVWGQGARPATASSPGAVSYRTARVWGLPMHIVQVDGFLFNSLGGKTAAPTINQKATTKADILAALKQSYDWQAAVLKEFNDQQLVERVTPPPFLGSSASRVKVFYYDLQHTEDIYGQLVVYLRLNGVTPPASQRGGV